MFDDVRYKTEELFTDANLKLESNDVSPKAFKNKKIYVLTDNRPKASMYEGKLGPVIHNLDNLSDDEISKSIFYTFFTFDDESFPNIKRIKDCGGIFIPPVITHKVEYHWTNRLAFDTIIEAKNVANRTSHWNVPIYNNIMEAIDITKDLEGDVCEIGVYLGGSSVIAGIYMRKLKELGKIKDKNLFLFDTFDGFNYNESQNSSDQIWNNTHKLFGMEQTIKHVAETLTMVGVDCELFCCNICTNNLPEKIQKISVVNIDVDMYEPTIDALNKVSDLVVSGGIIICEDPSSTPALYGGYMAMNEFLESEKGKQYIKVFKGSQYFLIKR